MQGFVKKTNQVKLVCSIIFEIVIINDPSRITLAYEPQPMMRIGSYPNCPRRIGLISLRKASSILDEDPSLRFPFQRRLLLDLPLRLPISRPSDHSTPTTTILNEDYNVWNVALVYFDWKSLFVMFDFQFFWSWCFFVILLFIFCDFFRFLDRQNQSLLFTKVFIVFKFDL